MACEYCWGQDFLGCQECQPGRFKPTKLLPIEPTPSMIEAGAQRLVRWQDDSRWPEDWDEWMVVASRNDAERVWRSLRLCALLYTSPEVR